MVRTVSSLVATVTLEYLVTPKMATVALDAHLDGLGPLVMMVLSFS